MPFHPLLLSRIVPQVQIQTQSIQSGLAVRCLVLIWCLVLFKIWPVAMCVVSLSLKLKTLPRLKYMPPLLYPWASEQTGWCNIHCCRAKSPSDYFGRWQARIRLQPTFCASPWFQTRWLYFSYMNRHIKQARKRVQQSLASLDPLNLAVTVCRPINRFLCCLLQDAHAATKAWCPCGWIFWISGFDINKFHENSGTGRMHRCNPGIQASWYLHNLINLHSRWGQRIEIFQHVILCEFSNIWVNGTILGQRPVLHYNSPFFMLEL